MDRLSIFLSLVSGAAITGTLVVIVFSLGYYAWWAIILCIIFGFAMAWPSGFYISRLIKKNDPAWEREIKDAKGSQKEV